MDPVLSILASTGPVTEQELRYQLERRFPDLDPDDCLLMAAELAERGLVTVEWRLTAAGRAEAKASPGGIASGSRPPSSAGAKEPLGTADAPPGEETKREPKRARPRRRQVASARRAPDTWGGWWMATTAIEWTDQSWNPVTGCSKVPAASVVGSECDHCYAETLALGRLAGKRGYPGLPWTPENAAVNVVLRPERLDQPKRWRRPSMVFVNSMSDLFHPRVPGEFIAEVFTVMADCPQHVFQVLTKRPKRMREWTRRYQPEALGNVWLGTSIGLREKVGRADLLRETPAAVRFISAEPLLEPLVYDAQILPYPICEMVPRPTTRDVFDLMDEAPAEDWRSCWGDGYEGPELDLAGIDWLIVGGESGPRCRPIGTEWVRDLRDATRCVNCRGSGVHHIGGAPASGRCTFCEGLGRTTAFFFKQWGGLRPKSGGRELDGRTWDELPEVAR